jgi:hypothetical protein
MDSAAEKRGLRFAHFLQTNLISYTPRGMMSSTECLVARLAPPWTTLTSIVNCFLGGAEAYTKLWTQRLGEAKSARIEIGVIAVLLEADRKTSTGAGNSVKGQLVAQFLSRQLGMDLFVSQPEI